MIAARNALWFLPLASIAVAFGGDNLRAAPASAAAASSVRAWEAEEDCRWWMSADDGGHRAAISPGETGMVLSISDPFFRNWSDSEAHKIHLGFDGDPPRPIEGEAWVTHISGRPASMVSIDLDAAAVAGLGGATRVSLFRDPGSVFAMDMAGTPDKAVLEACIPSPNDGPSEAES